MKNFFQRAISALAGCVLGAGALLCTLPENEPLEALAASDCVIDSGSTYQKITGFGGMNHPEWVGDLTAAQRETAFGNGANQLGLTVCRIFVNHDSSQWNRALATAKAAQAKGAIVFASPWNPPESMCEKFQKNGDNDAKRLKKSSYAAYAQHLNNFVKYMKDNGVNLACISIQNEPDWGFDWTWWTEDECVDFLANYADKIDCPVMSPESFSYRKSYYEKILANSKANQNTDYWGTHFYGTSRQNMDFPTLEKDKREIWMTEVYTDSKQDADVYPLALDVSENIHNGLVVGNINAYVWWYIRRSYSPMKENGNLSKRGYCMAQYSKFIRPGDVRIGCTESPSSNVFISAYKNNDGQLTIVAINKSDSTYTQNFKLSETISEVDRYRTSANENLAFTDNLNASKSSFSAQLPAKSVSTFLVQTGEAAPPEPINGTLIQNLLVNDRTNSGSWSIVKGFRSGDTVYGDRDITASSVPAFLANAEMIRTACDSKMYANDLGTFTAGADSTVYAAVDQRVNSTLSWLSGWEKTAYAITTSNDVTLELFKKAVKKGDIVTVGTNGASEASANLLIFASTDSGSGTDVPAFLLGDVNGDKLITASDMSLAKCIAAGKMSLNKAADVDQSGKVDAEDIAWFRDFLLAKTDKYPEAKVVTPAVPAVDLSQYASAFSSLNRAKCYKGANEHNPLITQYFGADPGVMEYDGRIYIYMTDDHLIYNNGNITDNNYGSINCLRVISSADMVNWTDHGLINVAGSNGIAKWAGCAWAPTACHKKIGGKEKFFLYFANNANGIGVLTSDSPTGPWTDPNGKALISRNTATCHTVTWVFDPAVLVDDDGTGYLYFGGGVPEVNGVKQSANPKTGRVVKLGADMTSLAGNPVLLDAQYLFEDSGINKIDGKYYYSYCSNWSTGGNPYGMSSAAIEYMVSDNPMGPFTYAGEVFKNIGNFFGTTGNNHHTIMQFKGQYYLFYHAQYLQDQMGIKGGYRSTHIDELSYQDGKFGSVTGTKNGVTQVQPLNAFETVQAETFSHQGGVTISGSGNTTVAGKAGSWFGVTGADCGNAKSITVRASSSSGAKIGIFTGSASGKLVGCVEVPASGNMQEITAAVVGLSGEQNLFFVCSGDVQIDTWKLQ